MITVRERHAEWYCAIRPETAILGASPPGGPALSGGLVGGEQGTQAAYRGHGVVLVRRLYRHDRDHVVVLQFQAGPRRSAPELDRPDHVPGQVVAAEHVADPDPACVGRHPRPGEHQDGQRGEDAQPDHRVLVAGLEHALAALGRPAQCGGHGGEHHDDQYREDPGDPRRPDRSSIHSRHAWMSVTRMARAPTSYSSSMIRCTSVRATIAWTATQPSRCSGEIVGDSMPGVSAQAASTWSARTS